SCCYLSIRVDSKDGGSMTTLIAWSSIHYVRAARSRLGEEGADAVHVRRLVVARDVRARGADRVAEEVVLVEGLAAGERGRAGVPDQAEEPDPVRAVQRGRLQVGVDGGRGVTEHVRLGRGGHQAGGAELAQDLGEPLVEL